MRTCPHLLLSWTITHQEMVGLIHHKIAVCFHEYERSYKEKGRQLLFDNSLFLPSLLVRRLGGFCDLHNGRHSA